MCIFVCVCVYINTCVYVVCESMCLCGVSVVLICVWWVHISAYECISVYIPRKVVCTCVYECMSLGVYTYMFAFMCLLVFDSIFLLPL